MGDINVYTGPMKCGKTQSIINEYTRQSLMGKDIKIFKPALDTRFGEAQIKTRAGKQVNAININNIEDLKNYNADVYFIDEFQFLKGNISTIETMAQQGKKFFISGLNLTSEKKPFGKMGDLMCIADNVTLLTSVCEVCRNDNAIFSFFKGKKDSEITLGDSEYIAVCRNCYSKLMNENN